MSTATRQSKLALVLLALLIVRFVIAPILAWQSQLVDSLESQTRQLDKSLDMAERYDEHQSHLGELERAIFEASSHFYVDDEGVKLRIQKYVESLFNGNGVSILSYNWTTDQKGVPRKLRSVVKYKGNLNNVIKVFWDLAGSSVIISEVQSVERIRQPSSGSLRSVDGEVTLEFYGFSRDETEFAEAGVL